jgi:hypothetical protein
LGITVLALGAAPAGAASVPAPDLAVQQLNAWRSLVGVEPVKHDATLDDGCRRHAAYYRANPTHTGHREDPSKDGYSSAGDAAARSSVLGYGVDALAGLAAWEPTPYHRMALLEPRLSATGFWSEFGLSCMAASSISSDVRRPGLTAYTYPFSGQRDVPPAFWCREVPNPCEAVPGNDGRKPTGFIATVQFNGPWARLNYVAVSSATVAPVLGESVPLTVQTEGDALRGGILLIPNEPLALGTTYAASVAGAVGATSDDGTTVQQPFVLSWDFSTPGIEPAASLRVTLQRVTRTRIHLLVHLLSSEPRRARISLLNGRKALRRVIRQITGPSQQVILPRPRERVTTIGVLLRGSAKHIGVALRLPTDIRAIAAQARGSDATATPPSRIGR